MAPAKSRSTRGSTRKDKYYVNTADTTPHTSTGETSGGTTANKKSSSIDPKIMETLKGHGQAARPPQKFSNEHSDFSAFQGSMKHYLLMTDQLKHLESEDIAKNDNLTLYMAIANCLEGEALHLVQEQAFADGQMAYKLLCTKYLGNAEARKTKILFELFNTRQDKNQSIPSLSSQIDRARTIVDEFDCIKDPCIYTVVCLIALLPKHNQFFTNMSSGKTLPWDEFKEHLDSYNALSIIKENRNKQQVNSQVNHVKHWKTKPPQCTNCYKNGHKHYECTSSYWCTRCNNASHNTDHCTYISNNFRGRNPVNGRGAYGRGWVHRGQHPKRGAYGRGNPAGRGAPRGAAGPGRRGRGGRAGNRGQTRGQSGRGNVNNIESSDLTHNVNQYIYHANDIEGDELGYERVDFNQMF